MRYQRREIEVWTLACTTCGAAAVRESERAAESAAFGHPHPLGCEVLTGRRAREALSLAHLSEEARERLLRAAAGRAEVACAAARRRAPA